MFGLNTLNFNTLYKMTIYELFNEKEVIQFRLEAEALAYKEVNPNFEIRSVELQSTPIPIDYESKLVADIKFGNNLIKEFLLDNRLTPISFPVELNLELMRTFNPIKELLMVGDIKSSKVLIGLAEVTDIFTLERKQKYLTLIEEYEANSN